MVHRFVTYVKDVWNLSSDRIQRADPLLMGAAIAYNSLFALVPLTVAFIAVLTLFDQTDRVLGELTAWMNTNLASDATSFLTDLLTESGEWFDDSRGVILIVSMLVALWSGSRAVYAVQKALRTVEGIDDPRGYLVTRSFAIGVTALSAAGIMVAYFIAAAGENLWDWVEDNVGVGTTGAVQVTLLGIAIAWVFSLLWAVYRWGPPKPVPRSGLVSALVAALLVLGSYVAFEFLPTKANTLAVFGVLGVFLVWLYYIGIVIVAGPTVIDSIIAAARKQVKG